MYDLSQVRPHPTVESIVDVLCTRTSNNDRGFFRAEVLYFMAKMAASMRAIISTEDRGNIPVNLYVVDLAGSGYGKGFSMSIMENEIIGGFQKVFMQETMPKIAQMNLVRIATDRAVRNATDEKEEISQAEREYRAAGGVVFTFDSGSTPAVKQMRNKLLMANVGAINMQIDEIGSNLVTNTEVLTAFLELYDLGQIKQKLTKSTTDNARGEELIGKTPTNALLFGTPANLLDAGPTEDAFQQFLEIGYARRCLFGWGEKKVIDESLTAEQLYEQLTAAQSSHGVASIANHFTQLADESNYNVEIELRRPEAIELLKYKMHCEKLAAEMPDNMTIQSTEMEHRYFKVLKTAGSLAFVDMSDHITMNQLYAAMFYVEESGRALESIMRREKRHVKLAKFIAEQEGEVTQADLHDNLIFYKASSSLRSEMMTMAISWGYKNNMIIKKRFQDGIEFFSGESLQETELDKMMLSWSSDWTEGYTYEHAPWEHLNKLMLAPGLHWVNHTFEGGYRETSKAIPGFNMIALDVDGGTPLHVAHELLKGYRFITYTTKRHAPDNHRYRLLLPTNYVVKLDPDDYRTFMDSVMDWLPFPTDRGANQVARKWETNANGQYFSNTEGQLFDVLPFIPRTSRNDELQSAMKTLHSYDNLERWFAQRMATGNRNNHMIRFALSLVDSGFGYTDVENAVFSFNQKLSNGLTADELRATVLTTVAKRIASRP